MGNRICKIIGMALLFVMLMFCCSCTRIKCFTEQQSCKWDCPETIGLKQACEQKCNVFYDVCRSKE